MKVILLYSLIFFLLISLSTEAAIKKKNILYINSYQNGYEWSDNILKGILSEFNGNSESYNLQIEFMDSKKYFDEQITSLLFNYYKYKFRNTRFDVVITSDNNAFEFAMTYRERLFKDTPVIFCGLNYFGNVALLEHKKITGIIEDFDFLENLEIARKLHPEKKLMIVIGDESVTSQAIINQIKESIKKDGIDFNISFKTNINIWDIRAGITDDLTLNPDSAIIFLVPFYEKISDKFYSTQEICRIISDTTDIPVYSPWNFVSGYGTVGGKVVSGYYHGKKAAEFAFRVLDGEDPESIPIIYNGGYSYVFDYNILQKFNIKQSFLPEDSEIINKPYKFYKLNRTVFWTIIISVVALTGTVILLILNIIQRRKANMALKESRKKLRLILDNIPHLVFWQDKDLNFVDVNRSFLKFFNMKNKNQILGKNDYKLLNIGEVADKSKYLGREVMKSHKPTYRLKWEIKRDNKDPIWLEINKLPLHDDHGNITGVLSTAEDITKKMNLEKQLRHSQKMEALGILSSGIAHDFNNILTSIINSTELALDDVKDNPITIKDLDRVLNAGFRGSELVKQILTFSKPSHQAFKPLKMTAITNDALELIKRSLPGNIEMHESIDVISKCCFGDPTQIHQIIMNLCTNSFQAMKNNGGELKVGLKCKQLEMKYALDLNVPAGEYVVLSVTDNGPGISEHIIENIFDPFFTTKNKNIGTGLGLSMVHGIVLGHKGAISIKSLPYQETVFMFFIPVMEETIKAHEPVERKTIAGNESILFVEDDMDQRESIPRSLEKLGYKIVTAKDAEEAETIFSKSPGTFDLVITDYDMPFINGVNLARILKKISPATPVILVSGRNVDFKLNEADNIRKFVVKPYNKLILSEAIRDVMDSVTTI